MEEQVTLFVEKLVSPAHHDSTVDDLTKLGIQLLDHGVDADEACELIEQFWSTISNEFGA